MLTVLLVLGAVALSSATIPSIGPCNKNIVGEQSFSLDEYYKENNGVWDYAKVPVTKFNGDLQSLTSYATPTGQPGVYDLVIKFTNTDGTEGVLANETVTDKKHGLVSAKGKSAAYTLEITFIKYVPGRYAFYFVCSPDGGDKTVDYRYLTYHGSPLSNEEEKEIKTLDKKQNFKGTLKNLYATID